MVQILHYIFYEPETHITVCTLNSAIDFLNVLKKYIMYLQVLVICDIMSLQMMAGKKYWDVMYTLRPSTSLQMPNIELHRPGIEPGPPLIECGRSTIELWNLYIIWVCQSADRQGGVKSYVTIAPPTHQQASMYTYTKVGGEGGALPTSPHPLNTCSHNSATRRPPHPSNTQQHTTTHNNTQQQTTTHNNSTQQHSGT